MKTLKAIGRGIGMVVVMILYIGTMMILIPIALALGWDLHIGHEFMEDYG